MMVNGAKMYKDMMRGTAGAKITEPELVLMAVAAMSDNRTAFERLQRRRFHAEQLLTEARIAGRALAVECGFNYLVTRFYDRLPEVSAEAMSLKPTPDEAIAQIRRQMADESVAPAPSARRGSSGKKKAGWGVPLLLAAIFGFYHAFSRQPHTPATTETVISEPSAKSMRQPEAAGTPPWILFERSENAEAKKRFDAERIAGLLNTQSTASPPIVEQRPSNFVTFRLPRGVEVQLPKGWWLLGSEHLRLIATTVEAMTDLSGMALPEGQKITLIAANSLPRSTYAAIRINSSTPPSMTRAELAAITSADVAEMKREMQQNLQKGMQAQGNQLLELIDVRVDQLSGYPTIVTEYRRTGPQGPVWVQLFQVFTERQEIGINLSYRESEAALWKTVVAKIRQSIVVKPWP